MVPAQSEHTMREHNTEMRTSKELYTNASVIIGGAVCLVLMANNIIRRMSDWNEPSVFPGFRIMCGLCFPILYFWIGTLLRNWIKEPKWWFKILIAGPPFMACTSIGTMPRIGDTRMRSIYQWPE